MIRRKEADNAMEAPAIIGIVILAVIALLVAISAGDIARYMKIRNM